MHSSEDSATLGILVNSLMRRMVAAVVVGTGRAKAKDLVEVSARDEEGMPLNSVVSKYF